MVVFGFFLSRTQKNEILSANTTETKTSYQTMW